MELYKRLRELLKQRDFFTVPTRRILYFLCSVLRHDHGYVAMSPEELLLRGHLQRHGDLAILKSVDVFQHEIMFGRMGLTAKQFESALKTCVMAGILEKSSSSDGQADFRMTNWKNERLSFEQACLLLERS